MKKDQFLYKQVQQDIKNKIQVGELKDGVCLPSGIELAEEYGVSTITITSALNALKEEGYLVRIKGKGSFIRVPADEEKDIPENSALQTVSSGREPVIGLVLEHVSSCFGLDMLYAFDCCACEAGYRLYVRFSYGDRKKESDEINYLKSLEVCGIIVMPCHGTYYNTEILKLVIEQYPVVLIDKQMEGIPVSSVRTDNHLAMKQLVDYLVDMGRKRIGFITAWENGTSSLRERRKGFWNAIEGAGLPQMPECDLEEGPDLGIFSDEFNTDWAHEIAEYLRQNPDLDAVVCAEYGVARCLGSSGEEMEKKGILVCCMDEDYLSPGNSHFTHIRQNERKIASEAMGLLLQQIRQEADYKQGDYLVPGIFVTI
ncbi:LacI family DNA-binding transcriptional regulator [Novisyntrophococcus fermenticellae]|uniref:LacI family DNA-binding transcriptional regulator n=1 Tax=Novisyntrophococcus fermenticellae TaxID=2068655 RepID=UPI001E56088F|nr:GntR family transcriptional regulator [Novisyntrophococcus fermenticellae]